MTSEATPTARRQLYVWVWLPGARQPVVAGVLTGTGGRFQGCEVLTYTYARSYRDRQDAIALFTPELPLQAGTSDPTAPGQLPDTPDPSAPTSSPLARIRRRSPLPMHGCLRDAAPDAWGRRIINLRLAGHPEAELDELAYLEPPEATGSVRWTSRSRPPTISPAARRPALINCCTPPRSSKWGACCPTISPPPRGTARRSAELAPRPSSTMTAVT